MSHKWIYEPRDVLWAKCCRIMYQQAVDRAAAGCAHPTDDRRLPDLLRTIELSPLDFHADVAAAAEGKPPRQWDGEPSPVIVTEAEDDPPVEIEVVP